MKLSNLAAKLTCSKTKLFTALGSLAIAGAALTAAAPAAQAQFAVGVRIGGPRYVAPARPVYVAPAYGYGYRYAPRAYGYDRGYDAPVYRDDRRVEDGRARERFDSRRDFHERGRGW
jgi:hypothetical protein